MPGEPPCPALAVNGPFVRRMHEVLGKLPGELCSASTVHRPCVEHGLPGKPPCSAQFSCASHAQWVKRMHGAPPINSLATTPSDKSIRPGLNEEVVGHEFGPLASVRTGEDNSELRRCSPSLGGWARSRHSKQRRPCPRRGTYPRGSAGAGTHDARAIRKARADAGRRAQQDAGLTLHGLCTERKQTPSSFASTSGPRQTSSAGCWRSQ
jgi:hypothetical protein